MIFSFLLINKVMKKLAAIKEIIVFITIPDRQPGVFLYLRASHENLVYLCEKISNKLA